MSLLEKIKVQLGQYDVDPLGNITYTELKANPLLEQLVEKAKQDIALYRHYPEYYTDLQIAEDIDKHYENIIIDLVAYDFSIDGANYESNHSENGVNRTFVKRETILAKVIPFCRVY